MRRREKECRRSVKPGEVLGEQGLRLIGPLMAMGPWGRRKRRRKAEQGFTLIELLVVMVILGLLAALVVPRMFGKVEQSKEATARTQIEMLGTALDSYRLDVGRYPDNLEELISSSEKNWNGPYLKKKKLPPDPWGEEYHYEVQDGGKEYQLSSNGGGSKEIKSWE